MTNNEPQAGPRQRSKALIAGTALVCGAGVLGLGGLGLITGALVAATRRRIARMPERPTDLAKRTWAQARAAGAAGRIAWREAPTVPTVQTEGNSRTPSRGPGRPVPEPVGR